MVSYDEILCKMKNAYFEQTGENPDMQGDLGVRFKAVASQIFDMAVNADYVLKQSNWKTATGDGLDAIGETCGVLRKQPTKAKGSISFMVAEPKELDVVIPIGTVCSRKNEKYIQYVTVEEGVILAGGKGCTVEAEACGFGDEYNCEFDEITVMVNPPTGIQSISNTRFVGGWNFEDDETFRERIKKAMDYPHNGLNKEYLCNKICLVDEILSCGLSFSDDTVVVWCKTRNSSLSKESKQEISNIFGFCSLLNVKVRVAVATGTEYSAKLAYLGTTTVEEIKNAVKGYISSLGVGVVPSNVKLESYLRKTLELEYVEIKLIGGNVGVNQYPVLSNIEVVEYDN